jgi:hypothetical protein
MLLKYFDLILSRYPNSKLSEVTATEQPVYSEDGTELLWTQHTLTVKVEPVHPQPPTK